MMSDGLISLTAEKWVQNGLTLGHNPQSGRPLFLHGALPGERVLARIVKETATHDFAIVEKIEESSPQRIPSDCDAFPACGGCSFRHLNYDLELEIKKDLIKELDSLNHAVHTAGGEMITGERNRYRNHIQIQSRNGEIGLFQLQSNQIVPLPNHGCLQISEELNRTIHDWSEYPESGRTPFRQTALESVTPDRIQSGEILTETIQLSNKENFQWSFPANGFFQNNRFLIGPWLECLRDLLPDHRPSVSELFSGSGIIGGFLGKKMSRYTGFESDQHAIKIAGQNFKNAGLRGKHIRFDLYNRVPDLNSDLVIVDPPRAGLNKSLRSAIIRQKPEIILYSSCNPHTLNRDLKYFYDAKYEPVRSVLFDFFPGTHHLEIVVRLDAR